MYEAVLPLPVGLRARIGFLDLFWRSRGMMEDWMGVGRLKPRFVQDVWRGLDRPISLKE